MAAALGAMTNSEQELQQLNMFLVMPLAFCMLMICRSWYNPDCDAGARGVADSVLRPLLMNLRISISMPRPGRSGYRLLMVVTIYAVLWLSSRIYRVGILMYGKKPNLPEILRWLKYS